MTSEAREDPYQGPVPESAWQADREARARGRVQMFNATRPGGLDGWTISVEQYDLLRDCILSTIERFADGSDDRDGSVRLSVIVEQGQALLGSHEAFPEGRMTNYIRYAKVDLEARGEVARVVGSSPQRVHLTRRAARQRTATRATRDSYSARITGAASLPYGQ